MELHREGSAANGDTPSSLLSERSQNPIDCFRLKDFPPKKLVGPSDLKTIPKIPTASITFTYVSRYLDWAPYLGQAAWALPAWALPGLDNV